jgi:hypothetical protein
MATRKPGGQTASSVLRQRRRWPWIVAGLATLAVVVSWGSISGYAQAGTAYGARVACSCRYLGERSLEDCRKDFEPGMELVMLNEDPAARTVTARIPLVASETATFREGAGCRLEAWSD